MTRRKLTIAFFILIGLGYYAVFRTNFPPCGYYESNVKIPEVLNFSRVIFEKPMEYTDIIDTRYTTCNKSQKISRGIISPTPSSRDLEYTEAVASEFLFRPLDEGTKFSVLKIYDLKCAFCWEHYVQRQMLLENEFGERYTVTINNLKTTSMGYYQDGSRLGDLGEVLSNIRN
ncbi:MAG: hypothetical protein WBO92_02030 [Candidatus Moraniibacteriota bacterium]